MPILFYGCFQEECIVYNIEMSLVQHLILKQCLNTHNLVDRKDVNIQYITNEQNKEPRLNAVVRMRLTDTTN